MKKIAIFYGTRPSLIDVSILCNLLTKSKKLDPTFVNTGQHYSYEMDGIFFEELGIPKPHYNLNVGSGSHTEQVAKIALAVSEFIGKHDFDLGLVEGDTNSCLGASLAMAKERLPYAHMEAGIRSFDRTMPEEINRVLTDQTANILFAPSEMAVENLKQEGVDPELIHNTGNAKIDICLQNHEKASKSKILDSLGLEPNSYYLMTAHRAENVDSKEHLSKLIKIMYLLEKPTLYPIHPRTRKRLVEFNLLERVPSHVKLIDPVSYLDFHKLCYESFMILSDSGGLQEEVSAMKKPLIVLRYNTERPEVIGTFAELTGLELERVKKALKVLDARRGALSEMPSPYGDGTTSRQIIRLLEDKRVSIPSSNTLDQLHAPPQLD